MGTHPIFESDFDCLTEREKSESESVVNWSNVTTFVWRLKEPTRQ